MVRASKSLAAGGAATVFPELYGVVKFFRSRFGRESSHQLYLVRFVLLSSRFFNHIFVALVGGGRIDVSPTKGKGLSSGRVPLLDVGGAGRVSGHFLHWGDFDTLNFPMICRSYPQKMRAMLPMMMQLQFCQAIHVSVASEARASKILWIRHVVSSRRCLELLVASLPYNVYRLWKVAGAALPSWSTLSRRRCVAGSWQME